MILDHKIMLQAMDAAHNGITISDATDPTFPLIYCNKAFEQLTGYKEKDILGRNCRFLQGYLTGQSECAKIRKALENKTTCLVRLRNVRKDGSAFWNELTLAPVFDDNKVATHFIGIQRNVTTEVAYQT